MTFAYLIYQNDRYKQIVYFSGIIQNLETDYYFSAEEKINHNALKLFSEQLVTVAEYSLLSKLDNPTLASQKQKLLEIKEKLQELAKQNENAPNIKKYLTESINQLSTLEENLTALSQDQNLAAQYDENNYDAQDLKRFIEQHTTNSLIIKEIPTSILTQKPEASNDLIAANENVGLRTINSTVGITIFPIKGYQEKEVLHGQPQVGGCKLYPIFYNQISQAFKLMDINCGQEVHLSCFFNAIRDPLLGKQKHLLLDFLQQYGVECVSDNKNLDAHSSDGEAVMFEIAAVDDKSAIMPYTDGGHTSGLVIPLLDFLNFLQNNFNGELLKYDDFANAIGTACDKLQVVDEEAIKQTNKQIQEVNKQINELFETVPAFLGTHKIADISTTISELKEQDVDAAINESEQAEKQRIQTEEKDKQDLAAALLANQEEEEKRKTAETDEDNRQVQLAVAQSLETSTHDTDFKAAFRARQQDANTLQKQFI